MAKYRITKGAGKGFNLQATLDAGDELVYVVGVKGVETQELGKEATRLASLIAKERKRRGMTGGDVSKARVTS